VPLNEFVLTLGIADIVQEQCLVGMKKNALEEGNRNTGQEDQAEAGHPTRMWHTSHKKSLHRAVAEQLTKIAGILLLWAKNLNGLGAD
jgi:hypothetical protein